MPFPARTESWKLQDAKARLSYLVDQALSGHPQRISRRGKDAVVLMRIEDYEAAIKPKESLVEFFARSPHRDLQIETTRIDDLGRDIVL